MSRSAAQAELRRWVGRTLKDVSLENDRRQLRFRFEDGKIRSMYVESDCCNDGWCEDVVGDLTDLIGSPLVLAEESQFERPEDEAVYRLAGEGGQQPPPSEERYGTPQESYTWTFYRLGTAKGTVTLRWFGTSNGYYSEAVSIG